MKKLLAGVATLVLALGVFSASPQAYASEKGSSGGFEYIEMKPLMLPIIDGNGASQVINLVIALEVKDLSVASKIEKMRPKLTDAFIQDMYGTLNKQAASHGGVLQLNQIKKRLLKVSNQILSDEEEAVHDVLLQVIDQRQI